MWQIQIGLQMIFIDILWTVNGDGARIWAPDSLDQNPDTAMKRASSWTTQDNLLGGKLLGCLGLLVL